MTLYFYNCISIIILFTSITLIKADSTTNGRTIDIKMNPNCSSCVHSNIYIIYAKAASKSDILHYVYAAGNYTDTLSVIIIKSKNINSTVTFNYENLKNNNKSPFIQFSDINYSAFGLVFTKLYEYDNNDLNLNVEKIKVRSFNEIKWKGYLSNNDIIFNSTEMKDDNDTLLSKGVITFKFTVEGKNERSPQAPRLMFTGNNTHLDMSFNNFITSYKTSRFAVELGLINKINVGEMQVSEVKSLDDEYSPGIFRMKNFIGQNDNVHDSNNQTYIQWKPACYLSSTDHGLNQLSVTKDFGQSKVSASLNVSDIVRSSIAYLFFGDMIFHPNGSTRLLNATFGIAGDKGYNNTKYLVWTLSFGTGAPPTEGISPTVILVIAFGLGLPFVLVAVGSVYLIVKKRMNRRDSYQVIEDPIN